MAFYWRLKDIPELQAVPPAHRRRRWSEAVTCGVELRGVWLFTSLLAGAFLCALAADLAWPGKHTGFWALPGLPLGFAFNNYVVIQPRARRWLREHAGELDQYVSS